MVSLCWLVLLVVVYLCVPGRGSACWESSVCSDLSNKGRTLDCIHYCMSLLQTEYPELSALDQKVSSDDDGGGDLLLSIILALLASKDKTTDLEARSDQRRSYTMEHFRWGKPPGDKPAQPKQRAQSNKRRSYTMEHFRWGKPLGEKIPNLKPHSNGRRSYAMEHFRWGKPPGRKRRPVKVLASPDSSEGSTLGGQRDQQTKRAQVTRKGLQDRRAGTYRTSHFRWGGSSASKRSDGLMKPWQEKLLLNLIRTITVKDVQRRIGQMKGREEEEGGLVG